MQCRDPFSGDCDVAPPPWRKSAGLPGLQCRDPFSGDCDFSSPREGGKTPPSRLQCRDPFSGDCDDRWLALEGVGTAEGLAVPRPVFRGLRQLFCQADDLVGLRPHLAVPRPVFRGLRRRPGGGEGDPEGGDLQCRDPFSGDCDRAEISLMTWRSARSRLAVPRPVFRGLRHARLLHAEEGRPSGLQCQDPFSGDCDDEVCW